MQKNQADHVLFFTILALLIFGLVMIASIGVPKSIDISAPNILYPNCSDPQVDCYLLFKNHFIRLIIGFVAMLISAKISYKFWKKSSVFMYVATVVLLFVVLFIGSAHNTFARSWLVLFNTSIQPTEMAKLVIIFYLALWMEKKRQEIATFQSGFLPFCIVSGILLLPIFLQPDLGTSLIIMGIAAGMYFIAGARIRHLALGAVILGLAGLLVVSNVSHVKQRFMAFLNQDENCQEDYCWQTEQGNIAVGSGGFWGKGLTQGVQKSYWLPEAADDFIFAASAEEMGFYRIVFVIIAYMIIAWRGFRIAYCSPDRFTMMTASGITLWIVVQGFMNIATNIGLMPVTGITLPFVSYGGSSLISTMLASGVLLQISKHATNRPTNLFGRGNGGTYHAKYSYN